MVGPLEVMGVQGHSPDDEIGSLLRDTLILDFQALEL